MCDNNSMTNTQQLKVNTMKEFDVTVIDPWTNREVTHRDVPQTQLRDIDGETWFTGYNKPVEVITATLVSITRHNAMASYFAKYGTANE